MLLHSRPMAQERLRIVEVPSPTNHRLAPSTPTPENERGREQVAAVCYRIRRNAIEFLLVRTRKGRWTFPKGGMKRNLSHAESAALEAFEEAGVHGTIEESSFVRYMLHKKQKNGAASSTVIVFAHLCEVSHLGAAQEQNREPSWFSSNEAKQRLQVGRPAWQHAELLRVVERAATRITRLKYPRHRSPDPLQQVQFEAAEIAEVQARAGRLAFLRNVTRKGGSASFVVAGFSNDRSSKVVRLIPRLTNGSA